MNDAIEKPIDMDNEKEFRVSKTIDGTTKTVSGEKVENGWIISISKEWTEGEGDKKEWKHENKKYISTKNPLEGEKSDGGVSEAETLLSSILNMGSLMV